MEVAPYGTQRVGERAGQVVEQWLFLDRVNCLCADLPVRHRVERPLLIVPHTADAVPALIDFAPMVAERALHRIVLSFCVLARFVHGYHHLFSSRNATTIMRQDYFSFSSAFSSSSTSSTNEPR
jgi:hypothetical protein